jgi:hypothetical protein
MSILRLVALSISASLVAGAALAASVTNLDDEPRTVTVEEGESKQDHVVKPGAVLDGICSKGCLVRLGSGNDDLYVLEGPEVTTIENGQLWGEDKEEGVEPPEGDARSYSPPRPRP